MNKALIIPVIALLALIVKHAFGFEIPQGEIDAIADGVLAVLTLVGIFLHPTKGAADDADKISK